MGSHLLKDLARPEQIYQVAHPDLPAEFPPLHTLDNLPNNLPAQLSSFLGREETLLGVQAAVDASRLVTLVGPGGVGKTRLALQTAADRMEQHPDGVWLVELGGLADPDLVPQAVSTVLRVTARVGQPTLTTLAAYLEQRDVLLVVDNCEHLIDAAARMAETLLSASADVRLLATSREPLNIPGETTWPVPPMTVPASEEVDLGDVPEAVSLFVERATAADPEFELDERTAPSVFTICRRLDGLPLAIELAAARVRSLSVGDIAARIEDRLDVLSGGSRTALPHHQTLEATVGWSYDLLDDAEQVLFSRLGVFAGAFDLSAAEQVTAGDDLPPDQVVELVSALVDKSLLVVVRHDQDVRYRMLDTIRHYARARLRESDDLPQVERAHTDWAVRFAAEAERRLVGPDMQQWLRTVRIAFDDLRAVFERSVESGDPVAGLRILISLMAFLVLTSVREGAYWFDQLLSAGEAPPEVLAPALSQYAQLRGFRGDTKNVIPDLERSLKLFADMDDARGRARAEMHMAYALWGQDDPGRVRDLLNSSLNMLYPREDSGGATRVVPGDLQYIGTNLFGQAMWEFEFGDPAKAEQYASELEMLYEQIGAVILLAHATEIRGLVAQFAGQSGVSQARFTEAIDQYRNAGLILQCMAHYLDHTAGWLLEEGRAGHAAELLGSVVTIREDHIGSAALPFDRRSHEHVINATRDQLGASEFDHHFQEGRKTEPKDAIALAEEVLQRES